jgi:uncharacterized protein YjbI with pentapeptide repeats
MADETEPGDEPPAEKPKYDQAFFLDLAAKGKNTWNAWRRDPANKDVYVTFAGIDFSEVPRDKIDFAGFEFGDWANFPQCTWRGVEWQQIKTDTRAFVPGRAFFAGATFGDYANFTGAAFGGWATFAGATFGDWAMFNGTAFGDWADFKQSRFMGSVQFSITTVGQRATSAGADGFLFISFANARFGGEALFSGRSFERTVDFNGAHFYSPPVFDGATNLGRIDFTGARIGFAPPGKFLHWTKDSRIPIRLRGLRKIAEETKNHDLERDLYIEERKAERGVYWRQLWDALKKGGWKNWPRNAARLITHFLRIGVMGVYWALADYGRSFAWPLGWLFVSVFIFHFGYALILAPLKQKVDPRR